MWLKDGREPSCTIIHSFGQNYARDRRVLFFLSPYSCYMSAVDSPWCSMTTAHASNTHLATLPDQLRSIYLPAAVKPERFISGKPVKGRNEPSAIGGVAWVVHHVKGVHYHDLVQNAWKNTVDLFNLPEIDG